MTDKKKKFSNTKDDYDKATISEDPTKDSTDLEKLAKEAMKKFKSL